MLISLISNKISDQRLDIFYSQYGVLILTYLAAILCSYAILLLSLRTKIELRLICFWGQNSMFLMATHQMLFKRFFVTFLGLESLPLRLLSFFVTLVASTVIILILRRTRIAKFMGLYYKQHRMVALKM